MVNNRFKECLNREEDLRRFMGYPSERAKNKVIASLDEHCKRFIGMSPFLMLATSHSNGSCDNSPRGDAPGFVHIIDDHYFVIPERPGNKRMDSLFNILSNPKVGILFFIPGLEETLRINGSATIIKDENILEKMHVNGKPPLLGIAVKVEECFIHCAKAFKRSNLWSNDTWPENDLLPKPAKILADHANIRGMTEEEVAAGLKESYTKRLY
jgi:uncharacterized protein